MQQELLPAPNSFSTIDPRLMLLGIADKAIRKELAKQFKYFCLIYLPHYFEVEPAEFFDALIKDLETDSLDALLVIGFRGSAKKYLRQHGVHNLCGSRKA